MLTKNNQVGIGFVFIFHCGNISLVQIAKITSP